MMTSMTRAYAIQIEGLRVRRGAREVLALDELEVAAGAVTGLMGPSGCGKSTLMRSVVGVQRIAAGRVTVLGEPAGSPRLRARVGYMTQAPSVYGDLSVDENLRFYARVLGVGAERVEAVLGEVDLERRRRQRASELSGGERARVSLAATLLARPGLLVLDEPTVGLDPLLRAQLWELFRGLAERGTTLVISSHSLEEARHCDDLVLMRDGRLLATGSPARLRERTGEDDLEDAFISLVHGAAVPA
jgi:ABC-2 type transport system ATP-binding protein